MNAKRAACKGCRAWILLVSLLVLQGCAASRAPSSATADLPPAWHNQTDYTALPEHWLSVLDAPYLNALAAEALASNESLRQQALAVQAASHQVRITGAARWPALSANAGAQRGRAIPRAGDIIESTDLSLLASFELDVWGRLHASQQQALMQLASTQSRYVAAERTLVAQVASAAFNLASARELETVITHRLDNLRQGLDVIERGYRSGLNSALDVYLGRNAVEQEAANLANQQQVRFEAATTLQRLLNRYPDGRADDNVFLPQTTPIPAAGIPGELLTRRPDIQAAWYDLLAADAALAVAHRNRFPSLVLTASARDSASELSDLLQAGPYAFSVSASLLQPLFAGGRLQALEAQARVQMEIAEQRYLQTVFDALAEVENALSSTSTLEDRFTASVRASANAESALALANDQYARGLVNYTTVLESQRRAFDAQTAVVNLNNQRIQNHVRLFVALGGDY